LEQLHVVSAVIAAVLAVALGVACAASLVTGRTLHLTIDRLILAELAVVAVAIADGVLLLATGHQPTDPLHLLYALLALGILPLARFSLPTIRETRRRWLVLVGGAVLVGLIVRLWQTGGGQ
jgi:hypothetical protein